MSEMIERVARDLFRVRLLRHNITDWERAWETGGEPMWSHYREDARVVIAAMREPTAGMVKHAHTEAPWKAKAFWQGMIDHILEEKP